MANTFHFKWSASILLTVLLSACGGGGGSDSPATQPAPPTPTTPTTPVASEPTGSSSRPVIFSSSGSNNAGVNLPGSVRPPVQPPAPPASTPSAPAPQPPASTPSAPAPQPPASTPPAPPSNQTELINGIRVPRDPGDANHTTLRGIDSDRNGIRDDIDRFIAKEFADNKKHFEAAQLFSRINMLRYSKQPPKNRDEAVALVTKHYKNFECFLKDFSQGEDAPSNFSNLFEDLHSDTRERQSYIRNINAMTGGVLTLVIEYDQSKQCPNGLQ